MVAAGGVLTEIARDRSLRLAPIDLATAHEMIAEVRSLIALAGYRGRPAGDLDAPAHALRALSRLAHAARHARPGINPPLPRGAGAHVTTRAEAGLAAARPAGRIPVPGRARRADLIDAAFLGGTAAHGIELDDGFRQGSVHPGCVVVPAVLALGYDRHADGRAVMEAIVAGYEAVIAIGRACHPDLRQRGFHPTAAVGVFGSAPAAGKLRGLSADALANALGLAASRAAGLFAFVNGRGDIKPLPP